MHQHKKKLIPFLNRREIAIAKNVGDFKRVGQDSSLTNLIIIIFNYNPNKGL